MSEPQRLAYESELIKQGKLLPSNQGKRGGPPDDVFERVAAEIRARMEAGDPPDPKIFEEAARKAASAAASQDTQSIASPHASTPAAAVKGKRSRSK